MSIPRPVLVSVALAAALAPLAGAAADACADHAGDFVSYAVPPPECRSPVGVCTRGELVGDLEASYFFTMTGVAPAPTPAAPSRITYTGESTVTTAGGVMFGEDHGTMRLGPAAPFVTTVEVYDGTGAWAGAVGRFVATGDLEVATGEAVGTWVARLCVP